MTSPPRWKNQTVTDSSGLGGREWHDCEDCGWRARAFDQAVADFAETYADQNERDYAALHAAVKDGRAEAASEI